MTDKNKDDRLGYTGTPLQRVKAMALDELAGVNADAVIEESNRLRAILRAHREHSSKIQ